MPPPPPQHEQPQPQPHLQPERRMSASPSSHRSSSPLPPTPKRPRHPTLPAEHMPYKFPLTCNEAIREASRPGSTFRLPDTSNHDAHSHSPLILAMYDRLYRWHVESIDKVNKFAEARASMIAAYERDGMERHENRDAHTAAWLASQVQYQDQNQDEGRS